MTRFLSGLSLFLFYCFAYAEMPPEPVTDPKSNMIEFLLFGGLFIAICVGFVWLIIWNDKKQKAKQLKEEHQHASGKAA